MRRPHALLSAALILGALSQLPVASHASLVPIKASGRTLPPPALRTQAHRKTATLQHIVVVIQENRTLDNLLNGFCVAPSICADTVTVDPVSGKALQVQSMAAPYGLAHSHKLFTQQYDNGKMDGFPKTKPLCRGKDPSCSTKYSALAYVPASETALYRQMATVDGVLSDATFEPQQGPSFASHLYAVAGQAAGYVGNHYAIAGGSGPCNAPKNVVTIDMTTPYPGKAGPKVSSCQDFQTIFDLLTAAGHTWRYYSNHSGGFFSPTESIQHLFGSSNFITPSTQFLSDVQNGNLADVSFVSPWSGQVSDHPEDTKDPTAGPEWVSSIVNAVGETPYWNSTAVVVYWDDWGGFFDHATPTLFTGGPPWLGNPDPYEYGFRVPLIVASAYARVGTIDHTRRTFVSALRLIEETFNLPSLGTLDQYEPDGLDSMLNLNQAPIPFTPLGGSNAQPFRYRARTVSQPIVPLDED
jgi:phospholipase C